MCNLVPQLISQRTKEALARAKANGKVLGKYSREVLAPANKKAADDRAAALAGVIQAKVNAGLSLRQITSELNDEGVPTARGRPMAFDQR